MTIKEVAEKFDLSPDTLRFYEKQGLIGPIKKTTSGIRDYDKQDLLRIEFIKCMRSAEIPIAVLREYVLLYEEGETTKERRKMLLKEQKAHLEAKLTKLKEAYQLLNRKIDLYDQGQLDTYLEKGSEKDE